ncbi:hypothetical protein BASA81_008119 [Batrachochytrium salamandrivorans]|nr:hypothetical protein BASA81_008119 [Batrachochytrium salamandrivorans]
MDSIGYLCEVANRLKLKPVVVCTALVYWRRFDGDEHDLVAGLACLFLACKVEESGVHIERLLEESSKVDFTIGGGGGNGEAVQDSRQRLIAKEEVVLKKINFDLVAEHAQPIATAMVMDLGLEPKDQKRVVLYAHQILQDFLANERKYLDFAAKSLAQAAVSIAIKYFWFVEKRPMGDMPPTLPSNPALERQMLDKLNNT